MTIDRVQPLKLEDPATGGTDTDLFPETAKRNEDYLDTRGVAIQDDTSNDETTVLSRSGDDMTFKDGNHPSPVTLTNLLESASGGITEAEHAAIKQLIHFLDDGPGTGWASGAYKETLPSADPFPTQEIWWTSSAKTHKIASLDITRDASKKPTAEVWKIYATDGSTVLVTLTDAITYSGIFETTRTRTWA